MSIHFIKSRVGKLKKSFELLPAIMSVLVYLFVVQQAETSSVDNDALFQPSRLQSKYLASSNS